MGRKPTSHTSNSFLAREISNMNKGVVEGSIDVGNAEYQLSVCDLGTKRNGGFLRDSLGFWRLQRILLERVVIG